MYDSDEIVTYINLEKWGELRTGTAPAAVGQTALRKVVLAMAAQYSIGTWCTERQAYSPHRGLSGPSINITLSQLRQRMKELRARNFSCHRYRDADGSHEDNDWTVLIERTDGMTVAEVRKSWVR